MLPPGESRYNHGTDRRTIKQTSDRYVTLSAKRGQRNDGQIRYDTIRYDTITYLRALKS